MLGQLNQQPVVYNPDPERDNSVFAGVFFDAVSVNRIAISVGLLQEEFMQVPEIVNRRYDQEKDRSWLAALKCLSISPLAWVELDTCDGLARVFTQDVDEIIDELNHNGYVDNAFVPALGNWMLGFE